MNPESAFVRAKYIIVVIKDSCPGFMEGFTMSQCLGLYTSHAAVVVSSCEEIKMRANNMKQDLSVVR